MTPEAAEVLNNVADYILLAAFPAMIYFTIRYGTTLPWWRSLVGIMFFTFGVSISIFEAIVILSLFLGDYEVRPIVRVIGYAFIFIALWAIPVVFEIERRSPNGVKIDWKAKRPRRRQVK